MLCLAITCVLLIAIFLYVRQALYLVETRLSVLSSAVQAMADITRSNHGKCVESDDESEHSIKNDESDDESVERDDKSVESNKSVNEFLDISDKLVDRVDVSDDESELVEPVSFSVITPDEVVVKKIDLVLPYDAWSVKELKEKVSELNGPKLKTKKDLVDFLEKKNIPVEV